MRIGLLTLFCEDNPGQFFQALATVQLLRKVFPGAQVEIPQVMHWEQRSRAISMRDMLRRPWRNLERVRSRGLYDRGRAGLPIVGPKLVSRDPLQITAELPSRGYDLLVVGSDGVLYLWGAAAVKDNLPPLHWLPGFKADTPRVMLGSCSHTVRYDALNDTQRNLMSEAIKGFCFCGVRDPLTAELVQALGPAPGTPVRITHDPTFTYEIDPEPARRFATRKAWRRKRPLCGLRTVRTPYTEELAALLGKHFDMVDLQGGHPGCRSALGMGPFEWCGIHSQLDLHVTTSFHGTIFAYKQGVPTYSLDLLPGRFSPETGRSKMYFVHEEFKTLDRHYFNPNISHIKPGELCQHIVDTWRDFDRDGTKAHARQVGTRFIEIATEMASVVAGASSKTA